MIKKHGSFYWLDIRVRGKRIRRSLGTREHGLAIERAKEIELELRAPKKPGIPVGEFIEKYLEWARHTKPASSMDDEYRAKVIKSWLCEQGISNLDEISAWHVEQFRANILTRPIGKTNRRAGKTTANRYCALLRAMINKARDWGEYDGANPVSRVKFFREGVRTRPLSEAEVAAVLKAVDDLSSQKNPTPLQKEAPALFRFILNTGLRRSEALCLRWADIGDELLTIKGKGGKVRTIPLNQEAARILAARKRRGQYVFEIPGRTSDSLMRRLSATITKKTGVPFHLHLLRHVFASRLLREGVDIVTVSDLLGHGAAMTTLLYTHSSPGQMKKAVDTLVDTGKRTKKRK